MTPDYASPEQPSAGSRSRPRRTSTPRRVVVRASHRRKAARPGDADTGDGGIARTQNRAARRSRHDPRVRSTSIPRAATDRSSVRRRRAVISAAIRARASRDVRLSRIEFVRRNRPAVPRRGGRDRDGGRVRDDTASEAHRGAAVRECAARASGRLRAARCDRASS
jgi:hypothetical protein